jgi:two-component system chemotaxis response regulator CheY
LASDTRGPIRVLVVDDEKPLQELLKCSLEAFGLAVIGVASNGKEAVEAYPQLNPDAVVMDIRMPVMDGLAALKQLKTNHPDSVVLMITANQEEAQRQEALRLGASGFLHKPFRVDELFQDINRAFRSLLARRTEQPLDDQYVRYVLGQQAGPLTTSGPVRAPGAPAGGEVQFVEPARPAAPASDDELAALKRENRELREQIQSARDTCAQLLAKLEAALKKLH